MAKPYGADFQTVDVNPAVTGHWSTKGWSPGDDFGAIAAPTVARFNWLAQGINPVIRDQGAWNACSSFALTAMIEARRHIRGLATTRLNAGFAHYCRIGERDPNRGHSPPEIAAVATAAGLMPGVSDGFPLSSAQCAHTPQAAIRIIGSGYVDPGAKAANQLVREGPLLIEVPLPTDFDKLRTHKVWRTGPIARPVLHSMLLTGYDWPAQTITVLGSNGAVWGNGGFATLDISETQFLIRCAFAVSV